MSARPWEAAFFQEATAHAAVRMVARIEDPWDLARLVGCVDVVVVGSETPWLEDWVFHALHRLGCGTLGVYRAGDRVGARLVAQSTTSLVESTPPGVLVRSVVAIAQSGSAARSIDRSTSEPQTQRYRRASGSTGR